MLQRLSVNLIKGLDTKMPCIMARDYIKSNIDCHDILQTLQDRSELEKKPIDFSGIETVAFSGHIKIGSWFHWIGAGKHTTTLKPLSLTRQEVGTNGFGTYAWITRRNPDTSLEFALLQDIGFDGQYQDGYQTDTTRLVRAFCWHFNNQAVGRNIFAVRCHFKDCPHEAWEGHTTNGGRIDTIGYLHCSSIGTDPTKTAVGFNAFKCMNGTIDNPGVYGAYTIRNIISIGNTASGHRTMNDFKRGCEVWFIDKNTTYDMNDCHHSTDGSRLGIFSGSNIGIQNGLSQSTKNFFEVQGENIDILGGKYVAAPSSSKGIAGIFVTQYAYPSETGKAYQSKGINIFNFRAERVGHNAVRLINTENCLVSDIHATSCDGVGVAFEYVADSTSGVTGQPIVPSANKVGSVFTSSCLGEVHVDPRQDVTVIGGCSNNAGGFRVGRSSSVYTAPSALKVLAQPMLSNFDRTMQTVSSAAPAKTDANTQPLGVSYAFTLKDQNNASVQSLRVGTVLVKNKGAVYVKVHVKLEDSSTAAIVFREVTESGGALRNSSFNLHADTSWKEKQVVYHVTNANCAAVHVELAPACDSGLTVGLTGSTSFADVRIAASPM